MNTWTNRSTGTESNTLMECNSSCADMELILIGGGVSKAGRFLTDPIEEYFRKFAFHTQKDTKFKLAELGNDAGIHGAARMMIHD